MYRTKAIAFNGTRFFLFLLTALTFLAFWGCKTRNQLTASHTKTISALIKNDQVRQADVAASVYQLIKKGCDQKSIDPLQFGIVPQKFTLETAQNLSFNWSRLLEHSYHQIARYSQTLQDNYDEKTLHWKDAKNQEHYADMTISIESHLENQGERHALKFHLRRLKIGKTEYDYANDNVVVYIPLALVEATNKSIKLCGSSEHRCLVTDCCPNYSIQKFPAEKEWLDIKSTVDAFQNALPPATKLALQGLTEAELRQGKSWSFQQAIREYPQKPINSMSQWPPI